MKVQNSRRMKKGLLFITRSTDEYSFGRSI